MNPNDEYIITGYLKSGDILYQERVKGEEILNIISQIRENRFREYAMVRITVSISFNMKEGK